MKNKLQTFFLLIFCAAVVGAAACNVSAQNARADKILVAGNTPLKQSDVDKLIEFYEWAFETDFTANERRRYQAFVVEGFRQDAATARKDTDVLIKALARARQMDAAEQAKLRRAFNEGYVKDLRAATDDGSRLMLTIYERGQNGESNGGETAEILPSEADLNDAPQPARANGGGAGASKLVGAWTRSDGTGGADDGTGKTRYNSGTDTTFEFFADGRMRVSVKSETLSITQCRINETTVISGTYQTSGDDLTMNLSGGTSVGSNSCERSGNFNKKLSASSLKKTFVVKELESVFRPDRPLILCLDGAADDKCFERDPKR